MNAHLPGSIHVFQHNFFKSLDRKFPSTSVVIIYFSAKTCINEKLWKSISAVINTVPNPTATHWLHCVARNNWWLQLLRALDTEQNKGPARRKLYFKCFNQKFMLLTAFGHRFNMQRSSKDGGIFQFYIPYDMYKIHRFLSNPSQCSRIRAACEDSSLKFQDTST